MSPQVPSLAVIGAINVDLVVSGAQLPRPGETVVGGTFAQHDGGKGGNQAVAAARVLGSNGHVLMVGVVGEEDLGRSALENLRAEGVDTTGVTTAEGATTGVALIAVDDSGENQISVAPGANGTLSGAHVVEALNDVTPTVVLASLEVPIEAAGAAGIWCADRNVTFVLNPAPMAAEVRELLPLVTYLTPNEHELAALDGIPDGVVVIETRGRAGARIREGGATTNVASPAVDVVDTTGAGDCFNGVFAAGLLEGFSAEAATGRAVAAAALSVTTPGARSGMPRSYQLDAAGT